MGIISQRHVLYGLTLYLLSLNFTVQAANITSTAFVITGVLEAKTCTFNETTRSIDLPEVDTRSLVGSNSIQGKTDFTLSINCSGGVTEVNITPSGMAVSNGDSSLFLNTSSARNIGLRLLDNTGGGLKPDGSSKITINYNESGGKYTFSAGYAETGAGRVSGGLFQALVVFSLEYS